ncbi:S24 family peptidase [Porphyromonas gulae]|uniref:S24 family peptidase n=1 Tax=Porphyromonas gulae TaxID=111105 RepID=UPI001F3E635E|nr:S24 family peptidase [Porphyromonas gulae]
MKGAIGAEKLEGILMAYPELNKKWLLAGEGSMLVNGSNNVVVGGDNKSNNGNNRGNTTNNNYYSGCPDLAGNTKPTISGIESSGRPYYDVDFIGGFDLVLNDQTVTPAYNIDFAPYNRDGIIWCNITGRSMEPEIGNGDIIAIKEVHDWQQYISYGEIYAIVTDNDMRTVKRVRKGIHPESVLLVPTNSDYDTQEIEKSVIHRVFSVLGCLKRL